MSKKKDPKIIRVGDYVKIIKPDVFIRCGYPMDFKEQTKAILNNHLNDIRKFLKEIFNIQDDYLLFEEDIRSYSHCEEKIAKAIAYVQCKNARFGGKERKIYTEYIERFLEVEGVVDEIRFVKTGTYYAPSGGYSYNEDYDYDPGGLINEKTHKILTIQTNDFNDFEIEAINVIKTKESDNEFFIL